MQVFVKLNKQAVLHRPSIELPSLDLAVQPQELPTNMLIDYKS